MIVLYNPVSTSSPHKPLPMSLLALGSMLEGRHDYRIIDGNLIADPVSEILDQAQLEAVAMTVMPGPQLEQAIQTSKRLRAALPQVPIVWGGYFPSQHSDVVLQEDYVDFCVRGQGEQTFLELIEILERGGSLVSIAGLSHKENGAIRHNPRRPLLDLDQLPDWPYHQVPMERYLHSHFMGRRVSAHHSSFGCPYGCNFCAVVDLVQQRWAPQSPKRMEQILRRQQEDFGIDAIQFHDMDFFISEERTAEFAERIRPLGIRWWALGRVDELMRYSEDTWQKMKASGLIMIFCGAESGSDQVLERMNKGGKSKARLALELAGRMASHEIVPEFSFVVGSPPDPEKDAAGTIEFIRRVKSINPKTEIILYLYTPVPLKGTLYEDARARGFRFPQRLEDWIDGDWKQFSLRRDLEVPWVSTTLKRKLGNFESVLNAYYPTSTDSSLTGTKRTVLKALGSWRYHSGFYGYPAELRAFHRLFGYRRPETTGF